jgi:hypothetical protein
MTSNRSKTVTPAAASEAGSVSSLSAPNPPNLTLNRDNSHASFRKRFATGPGSPMSLKQVVTNVMSGYHAYSEEQRLKEIQKAIKLTMDDAFRQLSLFIRESAPLPNNSFTRQHGISREEEEIQNTAEQAVFSILHTEVRSFVELQTRLRKAENKMDFMQKQLELRGILAKEQREELLKEVSAESEQHRMWQSKYNELLEEYREEKLRKAVAATPLVAVREGSVSLRGSISHKLFRDDFGSIDFSSHGTRSSVVDPILLDETALPEAVGAGVDVGAMSQRLDEEWQALKEEERRAVDEEAVQIEAEQRVKGMQLRLRQEQEMASKKLSKRMDDMLKIETQRLELKVKQMESQLKRKDLEMEAAVVQERERWNAHAVTSAGSSRAVFKDLVLSLSRKMECYRMELADIESTASRQFAQLTAERDKTRSAVLTVSRENDSLRREVEKLRGSKAKAELDSKQQTMAKSMEKTAKQLQATLLAKESDIEKMKETHKAELEVANEKIRALTASLSASEYNVSELTKRLESMNSSGSPLRTPKGFAAGAATHGLGPATPAAAKEQKEKHDAEVTLLLDRLAILESQKEEAVAVTEAKELQLRSATFRISQLEAQVSGAPLPAVSSSEALLFPPHLGEVVSETDLGSRRHSAWSEVEMVIPAPDPKQSGFSNSSGNNIQQPAISTSASNLSRQPAPSSNKLVSAASVRRLTAGRAIQTDAILISALGSPPPAVVAGTPSTTIQTRVESQPLPRSASGRGNAYSRLRSSNVNDELRVATANQPNLLRTASPTGQKEVPPMILAGQNSRGAESTAGSATPGAGLAAELLSASETEAMRRLVALNDESQQPSGPLQSAPLPASQLHSTAPPTAAPSVVLPAGVSHTPIADRGSNHARPHSAAAGRVSDKRKPPVSPRVEGQSHQSQSAASGGGNPVTPSPAPSPRVALRSEEMMRKSEEKRLALLAQQRFLAERLAITDPEHYHADFSKVTSSGAVKSAAQPAGPVASAALVDLVAKAQVQLEQVARQAIEEHVRAEGCGADGSAVRHLKAVYGNDLKLYERTISTQTEPISVVDIVPDTSRFPAACFSQEVVGSASKTTAPPFAVVLVCKPFQRCLSYNSCVLQDAPYIFRGDWLPAPAPAVTNLTLPGDAQGSSTTAPKPAFIESLHAAALLAMSRGRGGRPSSMLSGPEQQHQLPASNFDGLHTAIIAAPAEVLTPTPYIPTAASTFAKRTRSRPQSARTRTERSISPPAKSSEAPLPPALHTATLGVIPSVASGSTQHQPKRPPLRPQSARMARTLVAAPGEQPKQEGLQTAIPRAVPVTVQDIAPFTVPLIVSTFNGGQTKSQAT